MLILAILGLNIAISEWLVRQTWLRHLGSALLVILLTAVAANIGLIPTYADDIAVYTVVFGQVAPFSIFLLLLQVNLGGILRAGLPMLGMFGLGAAGTVAGVLAGMALVGGADAFGELHWALGGMFTGTYIGGSVNYNAVALEYEVVKQGTLYAGAAAVDSAATAIWMIVTVAAPRLLGARSNGARDDPGVAPGAADSAADSMAGEGGLELDIETVGPFDLAALLSLGAAGVWISALLSDWSGIPSVLILTTIALALAQLPWVQRLRGTRLCGWLAVMLFLSVIGALCDVHALARIGPLAGRLVLFVAVILLIHGAVVFGGGRLLRLDPALSAVASQANIGGSTSALALARSLGRGDLVLPGILVGALGNGLGTYLGFAVANWLR